MNAIVRPPVAATTCRICGHGAEHVLHTAREMAYGTRETFDYFECEACGCVQLAAIPDDLGRFYPKDYFSFRPHHGLDRNLIRRWIDPHRVRRGLGEADWLGDMSEAISKPLGYVDTLRNAGVTQDTRVLDVGCGAGKTLVCMALGGVKLCEGVDPFIDETLKYDVGVTVYKKTIAQFAAGNPQRFDLIMFQHSLEHVVDPIADLIQAVSLLAPGGCMVISVPVAGYPWEHYGVDWCNLDAPRHIHLLTEKSMGVLAAHAGLRVKRTICNGNHFQFLHSERYRRDIPGTDKRKFKDLFTAAEIADFQQRTATLNAEGRGDQMTFYLERAA